MTDKLKAILESMGGSGVEVGECGIWFDYGGKAIYIWGGIEDFEYPVIEVDIFWGVVDVEWILASSGENGGGAYKYCLKCGDNLKGVGND